MTKKPKGRGLAAAPKLKETDNLPGHPSDNYKDMSFKVPAEFHELFRTVARGHGLKLKVLLEECLAIYIKENGMGKQLGAADAERILGK